MSEHILAVDTTFGACSVAVTDGEFVLGHCFEAMQRGHAEILAPMVDTVMRKSGLAFGGISKLAVTVGPGSFTGQRVGLAFMRGLRVALGVPLVGVTSLAAMAIQARTETGCAVAVVIHDAKRGEVYLESTDGLEAQILTIDAAKHLLFGYGSVALAGTGAELMRDVCPSASVTAITAPNAIWVARLARCVAPEGVPRPLYLRPPDAKLPAAPR